MKKPHEPGFDFEFLKDTSRWGVDSFGRRRCCVKTIPKSKSESLSDWRFGIIFGDEPLTVWESCPPGSLPTWQKEVFESLGKLVEVWMVD